MTGTSFYSMESGTVVHSGGTTQAETRIYNERLVLSLIRIHQQLTKVELTKLTGLSPQSITTIVNRASKNSLVRRHEARRGGLGQPSIPFGLNPDGAFSFGLNVSRHSVELTLVNFVGDVLGIKTEEFEFPLPEHVLNFTKSAITSLTESLSPTQKKRVAGLGIASPFQSSQWATATKLPPAAVVQWNEIDIRHELDLLYDWPVFLLSNPTVSAGAELMFGSGSRRADFIYMFLGDVVGGAIVLDNHLFPGRNKMAGDLGNVLVPQMHDNTVEMRPLNLVVDAFSLKQAAANLEQDEQTEIEHISHAISCAIASAVSILDVDNLIIDGDIAPTLLARITLEVRRNLAQTLSNRPEPFEVLSGGFGARSPSIGGASIPLIVKFSNDKDLLFKD